MPKQMINKSLIKEAKGLITDYESGDMNSFNSRIERLALCFSTNPMRIADNIEITLFQKGARKVFGLGKNE